MNFHFSDLTKTVVVISVLLADTLCIIPDLLTLLSLFAWVESKLLFEPNAVT